MSARGCRAKTAILSVSPSVVRVVTRNIPDDMLEGRSEEEYVISEPGVIIECEDEGVRVSKKPLLEEPGSKPSYVSTIIVPATLFKRTYNLRPHEIEDDLDPSQGMMFKGDEDERTCTMFMQIDVYLENGKMYKGELLGCDFNYNLAAIIIHSDCLLQTATFRDLDDVTSLDKKPHLGMLKEKSWELRPHSHKFKVEYGTKIMALSRSCVPPYDIEVISGVLSARTLDDRACKEVFALIESADNDFDGGVVINFDGEVIGIMFERSPSLPTNLVSRWWNHLKNYRECRQPWLGVAVVNLLESDFSFLEKFARLFPNAATGVVVKKVEEGSPAYYSGIQPDDVIVKCDEKLVRSKLELFESMWDKAGKNVEMNVLRTSNGDQLNQRLTIGETTPDKFYTWSLPSISRIT